MNNHWLITQGRIVKTGAQNFVRNTTLAVAAMAVMVITLTIVLTSIVTNATFANTIQQITDKIDVSVYLKDDVTAAQREDLIEELEDHPNVKSVTYKSKEQALEDFKQLNINNQDLLTVIAASENRLPASLAIKPVDPNDIDSIRTILDREDIKALQSDETNYSGDRKDAIDKIASATSFFREAGFVGVAIFAAVSMLIIFNTIRMAIFNRRDELTIMRLLGASSWYIRGPFVVETIIYGVVSALISVMLLQAVFTVTSSAFDANSLGLLDIQFAREYFSKNFSILLASQLAIGILIGAVSSYIATRRYLKFRTSK